MTNIHTYTEPAPARGRPAFITIDRNEEGHIVLQARESCLWPAGMRPTVLKMSTESLAGMALDILAYYNALGVVPAIINGKVHKLAGLDVITYERVCEAAGVNPNRTVTVTYAHADGSQGLLYRGQHVKARGGYIFNAGITGAA